MGRAGGPPAGLTPPPRRRDSQAPGSLPRRPRGTALGPATPLSPGEPSAARPWRCWCMRGGGVPGRPPQRGPQTRPVDPEEPGHDMLTVPLCSGPHRSRPSCPRCAARATPPTSRRTPKATGTRPPRCRPKTWKSSRISEDRRPPPGRGASAVSDLTQRGPAGRKAGRSAGRGGTSVAHGGTSRGQTETGLPGVSRTNAPGVPLTGRGGPGGSMCPAGCKSPNTCVRRGRRPLGRCVREARRLPVGRGFLFLCFFVSLLLTKLEFFSYGNAAFRGGLLPTRKTPSVVGRVLSGPWLSQGDHTWHLLKFKKKKKTKKSILSSS